MLQRMMSRLCHDIGKNIVQPSTVVRPRADDQQAFVLGDFLEIIEALALLAKPRSTQQDGREGAEVEPILEALPNLQQYIFCSSAGVYLKSDLLPHFETDAGDPKSRHKGKLDTESMLDKKDVNWTSIRPVYIYGPLNYNPVEEWFFHCFKASRPIPVPGSGLQITQLGHVKLNEKLIELCYSTSQRYTHTLGYSHLKLKVQLIQGNVLLLAAWWGTLPRVPPLPAGATNSVELRSKAVASP
ncbi:hypothetical protein GOP47_0026231 [Adiantum capillus-veneris]|nr:hypothetical protein GOP47_0026231 [Adiantum capillus-veneris]